MGFMIEQDDDIDLRLTITAVEGFSVIAYLNGDIVLTGPKDAFAGIGELLRDETDDEQ